MPASSPASVQILDTSYVKPLQPTPRFNFYLPHIDSFYKGIGYIKDVLFYSHGDNGSSAICNIQALKQGLSVTLVDFYPVAGRLLDDADTGELSIDCNDSGAQFVEAVIDHDFRELEEKSFPIHDFYADLAWSPSNATGHQQDAALLCIQVTRFQDGCGVAIGITASHVVFDGHSLWYFLNSWGQCCRGQGVSLRPFHVRAVMNPECWLDKSKLPSKSVPHADVVLPDHPSPKAYHKVMHFDSASVQRLKKTAVEESGNMRISSFQAVMACVWKRCTEAQDLLPHQKVCLNVGGNVRKRLRPSLTEAYFGNAVEPLYIYATAGDLMRESVGAVAEWINRALRVFEDQTYLRERLTKDRVQEFNQIMDEAVQEGTDFLFITHGSKFPVYDIDVGMGKPIAVRPPTIGAEGIVYVYPSREQGGIDVCVHFSSMERLEAFLFIPSPCVDI